MSDVSSGRIVTRHADRPRARNPKGEGERLRREILDAACRLVSELGGADALTMRGVARAVGIAPASIYTQFADKNALIQAVIADDRSRLTRALREADGRVPEPDTVGRARAQVHAYCRFAIDNPGHYRLLLGPPALGAGNLTGTDPDADGPPASEEPSRNSLSEVVRHLAEAFARCERAGVRLRLPAGRVGAMVFVAAHGRVALHHADPAEHDPDVVYAFVDELIAALVGE